MSVKIVVATGNSHKITEINAALAVEGYEFVSIYDIDPNWISPIEDGDTFEANATIKAMTASQVLGMPALADDSGLVVDALLGAPGVHSSRYAGDEGNDSLNNTKLQQELDRLTREQDLSLADRAARFVSCLVLVGLDLAVEGAPAYICVQGSCEGIIGLSERGENGFGYDPLFLPYATPGRSMAELSLNEKNSISHRGYSLELLRDELEVIESN